MLEEIDAAVLFVRRFVERNSTLTKAQIQSFGENLSQILQERFRNHWYEHEPTKGQGYRCIRINEARPVDPILEQAAMVTQGLKYGDLRLPPEMTLWVDPHDVYCRQVIPFDDCISMQCIKLVNEEIINST